MTQPDPDHGATPPSSPAPGAKPWGGRFSSATHAAVEAFTASIQVDARLADADIRASKAHAAMLAKIGLISTQDAELLSRHLTRIGERLQRGELPLSAALEDIHMHIEAALIADLGPQGDLGRKLHTARSRNDQVSTALRLWTRDAIDGLVAGLAHLQACFLAAAERHGSLIMPAYTHLQRAQPIVAAHSFLAHVERLERDRERLLDARRRVNRLPLGTAALAGTSLPIDREFVRRLLGFEDLCHNSLDASADRDFVAETCFALSMIAVHLSGWAEEWILWCTKEFGFLSLPDQLCTGSSIMPQKKNPDVLELIRGRTGKVIGALQGTLVLLKGLPLAYNRDLQEDKPLLFDAVDTVKPCLELACLVVDGARLEPEPIAKALAGGFLDATALMEELIRRGVPMRTAHHVVGALVRQAEERGVSLADLSPAELAAAHPSLDAGSPPRLGAVAAAHSYVSDGSGSPAAVSRAMERWRQVLASRSQS